MRPKACSYLIDDGDKNKNAKVTKRCVINPKLESEDYKYCLKATQLENEINQLGNYKLDVDSIRENFKDFIKSNRSILKS